MKDPTFPEFQIVTEVPEPLALFFRPGRADHTTLSQIISEHRVGMSGVVLDRSHLSFQNELLTDCSARGLYTVLDTLTMEMATPGGLTSDRTKLPWADPNPHFPGDFDRKKIEHCTRLIARCVKEHGFDSVFAPTHYLAEGTSDPWLLIDRRLTLQLRRELDEIGCEHVLIYYPLAVPTSVFFNTGQRSAIKASLENLGIDALWLRVHPIGSQSGGPSLQRYVFACRDLHSLKLPLVAEKTGSLGLALLAFGAVSGIESGITSGEQFNFARLRNPPKKKPAFSARPCVYLPALGIFLERSEAVKFFEHSKLRPYACRDTECCQHGFRSMIGDPRRHFTLTRMEEIASLGAMPERIRATGYLQQMLRPADESLGRVLGEVSKSSLLLRPWEKRKRRLHGWRKTLTQMNRSYPAYTFSPALNRRIIHVRATA